MVVEGACTKCGAELPTHVEGDLCHKCLFLAAVFGTSASADASEVAEEIHAAENPETTKQAVAQLSPSLEAQPEANARR
jgi:hypothetical protein